MAEHLPVETFSVRALVDALPLPAAVLREGRIAAINGKLCDLLGQEAGALVGRDPFEALDFDDEGGQLRERNRARRRGEPVPDDFECVLRHSSGNEVPLRARVAPFPASGAGATLYLFEESQERARSARLIRGLIDVAAAAQREGTEAGIFRAVRERLAGLGLECVICEVGRGSLRLLVASEPAGPLTRALSVRGASWIRAEELPGGAEWIGQQGLLVEDVPALLSAIEQRPRGDHAALSHLHAVAAAIPVEGAPLYAIAATGEGLDSTIASAFALFGKQLGTTVETVRRLDELARRNRELLLVNHVARATATLGSGVALQAALDHVAAAVRADALALFRRDEAQLTLAVSRGFPFGWATSNQRVPLKARVPWAEAASQREIVHYSQEGDRTVRRPPRMLTPPHGVRRLRPLTPGEALPAAAEGYGVAVPLQVSDRVHGLLLLFRAAPAFGGDELELLSTVSAQLAVNLQNEALFDQAQRRVSELSLLLELGQAVVSSLELSKVLAEGARVAVRLLRCSAAYVMTPDESGENLICWAGADPHIGGALLGRRVPMANPSMSALAFRTMKPQWTSTPGDIDPVLVAEFGCTSTLAVPLHLGDKALGVLCLIERSDPRTFDPQDVRLANHAGNLIAVALENARLYAEQRTRVDEMARLNDLSRSLVGAVELRPILDEAARTLRALVDASHCFILLYDKTTRELTVGVGPLEATQFLAGVRVPIDDPTSLAARCLREKRCLQEPHAASSTMVNQERVAHFGERSLLCVPLLARDEPVGVVILDETRRERVFTLSEIEAVTAVAGQIALAALAARLYGDLKESYAELARTQAELVERERLAVVGELSASIAHEVRNPLGVIFNSLGGLRRLLGTGAASPADGAQKSKELSSAADPKQLLDIIGEEADRLNRMVGDLLDFARPMTPAVHEAALAPLLEEAVAAARAQVDEAAQVEVRLHVAPAIATVPADARLLRQAAINLVLNALQALGKSGTISVRAELGEREGRRFALLSVSDSGPGVPQHQRQRIFQPFFTTKAKGTGLGLAVVKRIAEGHGGAVSLEDKPEGEGASFQLWLPL